MGIVAFTIAYFSNSATINNLFSSKPYGTTVEEVFTSPDNWTPGTTTPKTITVTNSGQVDEAVRISYTEQWKAKDNTTLSGLIDSNGNPKNNEENSEHAAIINFSNNGDWTYSNGYYYYNYKLAPNESTSSLIDSVTFNSNVKNSENCVTSNNGQTVTCTSTESGYDGATYTLTFTIQTVQYDKYKEAWGTNVNTYAMKPMNASQLAMKSNAASVTNYTDGDIHQMYTFNHSATDQTPALTDYRYIGDDPYNYVYFNCDNLNNQSEETCEVWRIIGVFDVERPDPDDNTKTVTEKRMKLVRGNSFEDTMVFDSNSKNDWTSASLNTFLNNDYYNRSGNALNYGLKQTSRNLINEAKFYLGGMQPNNSQPYYGNVEEIYSLERSDVYYSDGPNIWMGQVGLMYASDSYYPYSNGVNTSCFNDPNYCTRSKAVKGWIFNSNLRVNNPFTNDGNYTYLLFYYGYSNNSLFDMSESGFNYHGSWQYKNVRPVVYLKSDVHIVGGNGTETYPYKLSLDNNVHDTTEIINYKRYNVGDIVSYDNQDYYVIKNSNSDKDYVTLIKAEPLTAQEINAFNTDYVSQNGEYPYLEANDCNNDTKTGCSVVYSSSNVKTIVDNWANQYSSNLVVKNGSKARLITFDEAVNNFGYEQNIVPQGSNNVTVYQFGNSTYDWAYISGKPYWTSTTYTDYNYKVYMVSNVLNGDYVYNKNYIRPVINLKKCAIDSSC